MFVKTLSTAALLIAVAGCSHQPMGVAPMGEAYRQQLRAQQVEPGYAAPTPVTGLNGKSAEKVFEGYLADDDGCEKSPASESIMDSKQ